MNVREFGDQCLTIIDNIPRDGIVITKYGRPVAKLVPFRERPAELIGSDPDFLFDNDDDLLSTEIAWDSIPTRRMKS
jgi:antitoxin (DNA-binding transcriptional repressor) of toxin-antitoxin stability system